MLDGSMPLARDAPNYPFCGSCRAAGTAPTTKANEGSALPRASQALPPGRAIVMGLDDDHLHGHGGPEQVNHLLVGQSGHGHLADLHEAAPLAKAGLPGEAERFHVCNDSFEIHVEAKLAQPVPPQGHFHGLAASGHYLSGGRRGRL